MPTHDVSDARRALAAELEQIEAAGCSWEALGMVASDQLPLIIDALRADPARAAEEMKGLPRIEFHQQDWIPGFAAFLPGATTPRPDSKAFCVLNLGSMLSTVYHGDTKREDLPYFLADSIMHEVIHVLEQWAGVEFSEDRVDALIEKYRALAQEKGGGDG